MGNPGFLVSWFPGILVIIFEFVVLSLLRV